MPLKITLSYVSIFCLRLSLLLVSFLISGVMLSDEPAAPLSFLLSPKFLASDLSRIAVYAVAQAVPYLPDGGLTRTLHVPFNLLLFFQVAFDRLRSLVSVFCFFFPL